MVLSYLVCLVIFLLLVKCAFSLESYCENSLRLRGERVPQRGIVISSALFLGPGLVPQNLITFCAVSIENDSDISKFL